MSGSAPSLTRYQRIYQVVQQIPSGKVATYGQVAELANLANQARQVGYALYRLAPNTDVPWHRVINAKGQISQSIFRHGTDDLQRQLLEGEGIVFNQQAQIDLKTYRWQPSALSAGGCEDRGHHAAHRPAH